MTWIEVNDLVLRAQTGDREAYGELVKRFQNAVFAMALDRVNNVVDAQELTQEVFVHAMRKLPQLRDPRCFAGWLRRITARMAINKKTRKGAFTGTEPEVLDAVEGHTETPQEQLARKEARTELREGLKQLKELDRETLEAFYLRGQSLKQMSDEFSTPVGTIKRRLHVARLRLKAVLEEMNEGPTKVGSYEGEYANAV
ncbi:MAG: sigma-70 family RNA polymerase sigma factor [Zavarzinella sp.]